MMKIDIHSHIEIPEAVELLPEKILELRCPPGAFGSAP